MTEDDLLNKPILPVDDKQALLDLVLSILIEYAFQKVNTAKSFQNVNMAKSVKGYERRLYHEGRLSAE